MNEISRQHEEIEWMYGFDRFWSNEVLQCDIIHIHCPDTLVSKDTSNDIVDRFCERIKQLKDLGKIIVVTCHNLEPHYSNDYRKISLYSIAYQNAQVFIHLGMYSLQILSKKYPSSKHVLIPHHAYDTIYKHKYDRDICCKKLHLNPSKRYILCFGVFRDNEERVIADSVAQEFYHQGVEVLAPRYYKIGSKRNIIKYAKQWLVCRFTEIKHPGLHIYGKYVSNELLPYFFGASDITLIQRNKILNSGNLALGFYFGNVVVGPNIGNVGEILKETNNPIFEPNDRTSLLKSIKDAIVISKKGKGEENRLYAVNNFSTRFVSEQLYGVYKSIFEYN